MGKMSEISSVIDELTGYMTKISGEYITLINKDSNKVIKDLHCRSYILMIADLIESYRHRLNEITNRHFTINPKDLPEWLWKIRIASNWARHHSEWQEYFYYYIKQQAVNSDEAKISLDVNDVYESNSRALESIKLILETTGKSDFKELFGLGSTTSYELVQSLDLLDIEVAIENLDKNLRNTI